ncbi:hypothetical protein GN956_G18905 [Arapaima gigas]
MTPLTERGFPWREMATTRLDSLLLLRCHQPSLSVLVFVTCRHTPYLPGAGVTRHCHFPPAVVGSSAAGSTGIYCRFYPLFLQLKQIPPPAKRCQAQPITAVLPGSANQGRSTAKLNQSQVGSPQPTAHRCLAHTLQDLPGPPLSVRIPSCIIQPPVLTVLQGNIKDKEVKCIVVQMQQIEDKEELEDYAEETWSKAGQSELQLVDLAGWVETRPHLTEILLDGTACRAPPGGRKLDFETTLSRKVVSSGDLRTEEFV